MKKNLFWMVAAALAFTGCSQDELVSEGGLPESGDAIAFSTYVGENAQSRATVVDNNTLKTEGFGVNAWYTEDADFATGNTYKAFMTNTKVTFNEEKGWTYSPLKYWPNNKDHKVSFFAYGPYDLPETSSLTDEKTAINFTVESKAKDQVDLIYNTNYTEAMNRTKPAVNTRINFTFGHALARIAFSVEAAVDVVESNKDQSANIDANTVINVKRVALVGADAENGTYTYDESNFSGPFYTEGTLNLLEPENEGDSPWTIAEGVGTQGFVLNGENFYRTVKVDEEEVVQLHKFNQKQPLTNEESYLMVIPQDLTTDASDGFKIYIEYDVITTDEDGNDCSTIENKIVSKDAMSVDFKQGMAYKFNLVLGMASVQFDASVTGWTDATDYEDEEWLPENDGEGESEEGTSAYELVATTNLTHNGTNILIEDANDLGEARDLINAGSQYKFGEGEDNMVYKVVYANEGVATIDDDLMIEGDAPIVMPGGEGESEAEPTFEYFYEASYLQTGDINLSGEWTPIGVYRMPFNGTYTVMEKGSGEYHVIDGLTISTGYSYTDESSTTTTYGGLFYSLGSDATVSNIRMTNVNISNVDCAAAIAASGGGFTISNCIVGTESDNSTISGENAAGIHTNSDGSGATIENCINHAMVTGEHVAGISNGYATVKSCKNYGDIGNGSTSNAGGISSYATSITDCQNHGNITATNQVAGILYSMNGGEIKGSYNAGTVSSTANKAGEIVAVIDNSPNAVATITGCYSTKTTCPLIGSVALSSFYESYANAEVKVILTSCYSLNNKIIGQTFADENSTYEARKLTLTCQACYYSGDEAFGEEISVTEGVTKVDGTDVTWSAAAEAMNEELTDTEWTYIDNVSNPPTFGTASAE